MNEFHKIETKRISLLREKVVISRNSVLRGSDYFVLRNETEEENLLKFFSQEVSGRVVSVITTPRNYA
jgi:hypothetical protein